MQKKYNPVRKSGVLEVTRSGKGFLLVPNGTDVPIPRESLGGGLSGDIVEVVLRAGRREQIGVVTKVLERKKSSFVGVVERRPAGTFLVVDDARVYIDFLIVGGVGSPAGQKVIADVVNWESTPPQATIRRSLGLSGAHDTEMRAILAGHDFDIDFNADVVREAEVWTSAVRLTSDVEGRRDFRGTTTFTIDPDTAKDFDDALSFRVLDPSTPLGAGGTLEVGVHIADVSHFVTPGSALDREAVKRATSVYLVDRTIPMLPPQLSEDLCSLRPDVDRLTYSAVFTFKGTTLVDRWFGRTVIHSQRRMTYDEADAVLRTSAVPGTADVLPEALHTLWDIAQHLRKKRIDAGAVTFDRDELKPILNEKKDIIGFTRTSPTASHQLIEELMLLANREVAGLVTKALGKNQHVFLYRVHDVPNAERLEDLSVFLRALGYQLTLTPKGVDQKELNRMLSSIKGAPEESLIKTATIRSMARAVYATKNIGHYGLSFKDYATFTSPIRRYPDVLVHRILTKVLSGEKITDSPTVMEELAIHASEREAEAADAERSSVKLKQVEYMAKKIGEERPGVVSGVTEWGLYIEDHESGAEGMVRLQSLVDDTYEYHPKKFAAVGQRSKRVYRLGDRVTFKVTHADPGERIIDLALLSQP